VRLGKLAGEGEKGGERAVRIGAVSCWGNGVQKEDLLQLQDLKGLPLRKRTSQKGK